MIVIGNEKQEKRLDKVEAEVQEKPWRREILLVSATILVITVLGWFQVRGLADDINVATRDLCQRTNVVRSVVGKSIRQAIDTTEQRAAAESNRGERDVLLHQSANLTQSLFDLLSADHKLVVDCATEYP